jgi:methylenetetrahydrofolate dehydrogenase (NADP+)/methenyltetrahydrofolate cyclohydrolase
VHFIKKLKPTNKMEILDGRKLSKEILRSLNEEISESNKRSPVLDVILVGDNYGSQKYVEMKKVKAERIGIKVNVYEFDQSIDEQSLIGRIIKSNLDNTVDGVMVQLPLPKHINTESIINSIDPNKDVDGLTTENLGNNYTESKHILSATPKGILKLLEHYNIELMEKSIVLIGWSKSIGMPIMPHLVRAGATVTVCHEFTSDVQLFTKEADIIISATGVAHLIDSSYIRDGVVVVDVGIGVDKNGNLVGDVDFDDVKDVVSYISPVPGGVGPMTVACLLENTVDVWRSRD